MEFHARPGYQSGSEKDGESYLVIEKYIRDESKVLADVREVVEFRLRYLPDTHEVVLLKRVEGQDDEAVYSEALS